MTTLIDVHAHVFPDDVVDAYIANYSGHSGMAAVCRPTVDALLERYRAAGFELRRVVLLPEWESTIAFDSPNLKLMATSDKYFTPSYFFSYNAWLGRVQRRDPRLVSFASVHPDEPDRVEELDRAVSEFGLKGLKLVPCMQHYHLNERRLFPVYERAQALRIPVLVHTGGDPVPGRELFGHPRDMAEVAATFKELVIITAHMGIPFFEETKRLLAAADNVFTDVSFTIDVFDSETVSSLVSSIGADRVVFGSDFPFVDPQNAVEKLLALSLSDGDKEKILWRNAERLLAR